MPNVKGTKYPYTKAGRNAAALATARNTTGVSVTPAELTAIKNAQKPRATARKPKRGGYDK